MKKIFALLSILVSICFNVEASRPSKIYLGVDALGTEAKHKYLAKAALTHREPLQKDTSSTHNIGVGVSIGYKSYINRFFVAPEIFYEFLNASSHDYYLPEENGFYKEDEIVMNSRYGFRMNFGYNPTNRLAFIFSAGVANTDYDIRWVGDCAEGRNPNNPDNPLVCNQSIGKSKLSPVYGYGISYDLNRKLSIKFAQDFQRVNARYVLQGWVSQADLIVTKLGLAYNF